MPVYNEAATIRAVLEDWLDRLEGMGIDFELHIYDDGSTDRSLEIMHQTASRHPRLIVHQKPNSGHGPTILQAYRASSAVWIFQTDSDGEIPSGPFTDFWAKREQYDFLVGRRRRRNDALPRRMLTVGAGWLVKMLFGRRAVHDVNIPFRLMRTAAFGECFRLIPEDAFAPNVLVSGYAAWRGLRTLEMGVPYRPRIATVTPSLRGWRIATVALRTAWQTLGFRLQLARLQS